MLKKGKSLILELWLDDQWNRIISCMYDLKKRNDKIKSMTIHNHRIQDDWIKEMNDRFIPIADIKLKEYYKRENSRDSHKKNAKKYEKSHKGKISRKRVHALRHTRIRNFEIPEDEKEMIRNFYSQCPEGFVVDHITPISKGGEHRLHNMQWIDFSLNARKSSKIIPPLSEYHHCRLDIKSLFQV